MTKSIIVADLYGKYKNPIAELVAEAGKFDACRINLISGSRTINAKSFLGVLALEPSEGMAVDIMVEGPDAETALNAMEVYLTCK